MSAILDASVAVDLLAGTQRRERAEAAIAGKNLVAPSIIDLEVMSALRRLEREGMLSASELTDATERWMRLRVKRQQVTGLIPRVAALRHNLQVADAFYVALAQLVGGPLITSDRRLATAPNLHIAVTLIA